MAIEYTDCYVAYITLATAMRQLIHYMGNFHLLALVILVNNKKKKLNIPKDLI